MDRRSLAINVALASCLLGAWYFFIYRTPVVRIVDQTRPAPDFVLSDLKLDKNAIAQSVSLQDLKGRVTFLHFWASWCSTCRTEMSELNALHAQLQGRPVNLIGIATNDREADVRELLKSVQLPFRVLLDLDGSVAGAFNVNAIPQTFILDSQGFIRYHVQGPLRSYHLDDIRALVAELGA